MISNKTITIIGVTGFVAIATIFEVRIRKADKEAEQEWKDLEDKISKGYKPKGVLKESKYLDIINIFKIYNYEQIWKRN